MAENDKLELDLEDIIREFSNKPIKEKLSNAGDQMKDTIPLEDVVQASREQEAASQQETKSFTPPPVAEDTRRFVPASDREETKTFAPPPVAEDTRRFVPASDREETKTFVPHQEAEETQRFTPLYEEEELRRFAEEDTTRVSRRKNGTKVLRTPFQIMRRKIVEGPERQYYALREKGIAGLQTVMLIAFLVAVAAVGTVVMYTMGYVPEDRMRLMIFSQLLLLLVSAFLGAFQLVDGLFDLGKLRFTPNTLLAFTFFVCLADCALCLGNLRVPCTAVFSIQVFMSLWGASMQRKTDTSRLDTMRGAKVLSGIGEKEGYDGDVTGFVRCDGDVDDFMDTYGEHGTPEKVMGWYCFAALIAATVIGGAAVAMKGLWLGVQVFAASLLVAMPATMFITTARPALLLERKLYKLGVVICGWDGAKGLGRKARFPITETDLFPADTVKLNGVKFYGEQVPAKVIGYAAAVAAREGGSLAPLLAELKESYNVETYEVESYKAYAGGIGGGVEGAVVLIGTLGMLKAFNVDVPSDIRLPGGIGIALDGKFSCLLAVNYEKNRMVAHGLRVLTVSRRVKPVLVTEDFMLSGTFLQGKFGIRPKKLLRPEPKERERLRAITVNKNDRVLALCVRPTLPAYGYAIFGGRAYYHAVIYGIIIHMLGGILGMGAMIALTLLGRTDLLTPLNVLLYQAVWLIPGFLITEWTRSL